MIKTRLAIVIATSIVVLTACSSQETEHKKEEAREQSSENANLPTYRIATVSTSSPLISKKEDGTVTGFEIEILEAIAEEQGFKPEFVIHKWKDLRPDLESGKVDLWTAGITIKDERRKFGYFSDPYLPDKVGILTLADSPNKLDEKNLKNLRIGVKGKSSFVAQVENVVGKNNRKIVKYKSSYAVFEALVRKKVDAMVANELFLGGMVKQYPEFKYSLKTLPKTKNGSLGFMIQKDKPELLIQVNEGLKAIKENGKFDQIKQKWLGDVDLDK